MPTAQARVVLNGYTAPASSAAVAHQPTTAIKLTGAALVNAPAPVSAIKLTGAALVNAPAPVSHVGHRHCDQADWRRARECASTGLPHLGGHR